MKGLKRTRIGFPFSANIVFCVWSLCYQLTSLWTWLCKSVLEIKYWVGLMGLSPQSKSVFVISLYNPSFFWYPNERIELETILPLMQFTLLSTTDKFYRCDKHQEFLRSGGHFFLYPASSSVRPRHPSPDRNRFCKRNNRGYQRQSTGIFWQ